MGHWLPAKDTKALMKERELVVVSEVGTLHTWIVFHCDRPPFDDVRMRQAVHYAINKQEIADLVWGGEAEVAHSPLAPWNPTYYRVPGWEQDLNKAKQLMEDAGYKDGVDVELATYTTLSLPDMAKVVQDQLKKVNIRIKINTMEISTFVSEFWRGGKFPVGINAASNKIEAYLSFGPWVVSYSTATYTFYKDAKMDDLMERSASELDFEKRKAIDKEWQIYFMEQSPIIVVCWPKSPNAWYNYLQDVVNDPELSGWRFDKTWIKR
jgi:peptide/nickel transport system substrate-binding protein